MKKSLTAVSVIIVLGAAWAGASWYTGKMIEQRMSEVVATANSQLKNYLPKAAVTLSYENYQRGLFRSQVRYVFRPDNTTSGVHGLLKPGEEVAFIETIDHGPFPLAQLKKLSLTPSLASVNSVLENTPRVNAIFDITQGKSFLVADTRIAYSGDTFTALELIPIEYQKDGASLAFSGAKINADISNDMKNIVLDANSENTAISGPNQLGQRETMVIQGLSLKSNTQKGPLDLGMGEQHLALKQLKVAVDGKDTVTLDDFNVTSQFGETGPNINGKIDYTMKAINMLGQDFGSIGLLLKIDNLDGKGVKEFTEHYNQQSMVLLQQAETLTPEAYQQQTTDILLKSLPFLLKGNPSFSVAPLSWKNSKGESTFTLNVDLSAPMTAESADQQLANSIKKLTANLAIPVAMATETVAQAAQLQGHNAEESQKMAQQQVQGLASMGQIFKLTTLKDNVINSNLRYSDNNIELNGNKMTLQEFVGLFGLMGGPTEKSLPSAAE